jgi:mRNA interferase YafQ
VLIPEPSTRFKKDLKRFKHQQNGVDELHEVIQILCKRKKLPEKYKDHPLTGSYARHRECHVKPDVLLIYSADEIHLYLERIGSHSELF